MPRTDDLYLIDMIEVADLLARIVRGASFTDFQADPRLHGSVCWELTVISEACTRLASETRERFEDAPWQKIKGFRNRLVHGYFDLDDKTLWISATDEIPLLATQAGGVLRQVFPETYQKLSERRERGSNDDHL